MRRDELQNPLGLEPAPASAPARRARVWLAIAIAGLIVAGLSGVAAFMAEPRPDAPGAEAFAPIVRQLRPVVASAAAATGAASPKEAGPAPAGVDIENGVRVVRGDSSGASAAEIIHVASAAREETASTASLSPAPDPRLVENGRFGPLPKIGADGETPFEAYRRPATLHLNSPRIALVITGMGLNPELTREAEDQLPPEVTFAFAPIGHDLWAQVAQARHAGHEILLQQPMEPLVTDGQRWPHELSTEAGTAHNLSDLKWSLSQFAGYIGLINFLGAKLSQDQTAMTPILREIASRGLAYVDDGTSSESLAPSIASALAMRGAVADVAIGASGAADDMDAALAKLTAVGRARGFAIGVAPGLPSVVARLQRYADDLSAQGIQLAPVSALMAFPPVVARSPK